MLWFFDQGQHLAHLVVFGEGFQVLFHRCLGFGVLFGVDESQDQGFLHGGAEGVESDCLFLQSDCIRGLAFVGGDFGEIGVDGGLRGIETQRFLQVLRGFIELPCGQGLMALRALDDGVLRLRCFQFAERFEIGRCIGRGLLL